MILDECLVAGADGNKLAVFGGVEWESENFKYVTRLRTQVTTNTVVPTDRHSSKTQMFSISFLEPYTFGKESLKSSSYMSLVHRLHLNHWCMLDYSLMCYAKHP